MALRDVNVPGTVNGSMLVCTCDQPWECNSRTLDILNFGSVIVVTCDDAVMKCWNEFQVERIAHLYLNGDNKAGTKANIDQRNLRRNC